MGDEDLRELGEHIRVLIREESETRHRLEGDPTPLAENPVGASHRPTRS